MNTLGIIGPETRSACGKKQIIRFLGGLLGLEASRQYVLLTRPEEAPFLRLQAVDSLQRNFLVVPPGLLVGEYQPDLSDLDVEELGLDHPSEAFVLNIVTWRGEESATVNLKGPIIINRRTLVGKQVIPLNADDYALEHPLLLLNGLIPGSRIACGTVGAASAAAKNAPAENPYGRQLTDAEVHSGAHREFVGGMWTEIGALQFEFLKQQGLKPSHRLLDIGCGCLRGGVHFVPYLEKRHYYGADINPSLIEAGKKELFTNKANIEKQPDLRVTDRFDLAQFGVQFDYLLAVSVFTHLHANHIARCLVEAKKVMGAKSKFFATFFMAPTSLHLQPILHRPGEIVTQFDRDPFHYSFAEMEMLARAAGLSVTLIGEWRHPRHQQMLCFVPALRPAVEKDRESSLAQEGEQVSFASECADKRQSPLTSVTAASAEAQDSQPAPRSTAYSCVLDHDPIYAAQCFIWVNCLLEIQQAPPENIFIHHTGLGKTDFADWLKSRGINLVKIEPYDSRSPHCNKLQQLTTFTKNTFDRVVLMDCDTAWVGHAPLPTWGPVAGKIVTYANPPESILASIFHEAGLGEPDWRPVSVPRGPDAQRSDRNNLNGGVYVLEGKLIPQIDPLWRKWANWCLDHRQLFGSFGVHVDQVGFALALRELGMSAELLPIQWNYSIHLPAAQLADVTPQIIHFHQQIGPDFKIKPVGLPQPDHAIGILNQHIEGFLGRHFINSVFWDLRYRIDPALGSGVGSRGDCLIAKRQWLGCALEAFVNKKVVDVGCGDLELTRNLPLKNYVGLDVSQQAVALARGKRSDWQFAHIAADEPAFMEGDAVICLDVLIHQRQASEFDSLIRRLANAARERLIVSGFDKPHSSSGICAFHRPIVAALEATGLFSEISVVGEYRGLSMIVADKRRPSSVAVPHDLGAVDFNEASRLSKRPDLLRQLVDLSRGTFGFYTGHFPRTIEYPWVAEKLETLHPGQRVLDVGAGLNPLPLFLSRRGVKVDTLDSHPVVRVPPTTPNWNEWGFYDYARVHPNLRSHHLNALTFQPESAFDVVYSVSVIEHMPRAVWEAMLDRCRGWLARNGRLVLTIDLIPGTQLLWNYSEGVAVEPVEVHGNVDDFVSCLRKLDFTPTEISIRRQVPKSRTDLLFIDCVAN